MNDGLFDVDSSRELVPTLRPLVERLALAHAEMSDPARQDQITALAADNASWAGMAELIAPAETVTRLLAQLDGLGVVVRDAESGLIDFPARRDGDDIYLCWRLGEETVGHWHPRDAGFAGRQEL